MADHSLKQTVEQLEARTNELRSETLACLAAYNRARRERSAFIDKFEKIGHEVIAPALREFVNGCPESSAWFNLNEAELSNPQTPLITLGIQVLRLASSRPRKARLVYSVAREGNWIEMHRGFDSMEGAADCDRQRKFSPTEITAATVQYDASELFHCVIKQLHDAANLAPTLKQE